jgi:hypothetical protein
MATARAVLAPVTKGETMTHCKLILLMMALGLLLPGCGPEAEEEVEGDEPGECADGTDNDQDGVADCDDSGCGADAACAGDDDDDAADDDDVVDDDDVADDDDVVDDDDVADDDDVVDDDDAVDLCATAVPCMGGFNIQNSFDLDEVAVCESVSGNLVINGGGWLSNLDDLSCLTSVNGELSVYGSAILTNLDGLSGLTSVGGDLYVYQNTVLTSLDGLSGVTSVGGNLTIQTNPQLCQSLVDAFVAACTVGGSVLDLSGNNDGC